LKLSELGAVHHGFDGPDRSPAIRRITLKKTAHASEQERSNVARRRRAWFEAQPDLDPERLVFIDETG
jgi:hypothetical protein